MIYRGIQENPEYWRFYEDLGFIYYFELHDYDKAAAAFLEGSKNPNAKTWMKVLAAKVSEQGDNSETSAFLWNEIYTSTTDPQMKENAGTHLQLLKAQADCDALDGLIAEYAKRTGRAPADLRDLVKVGMLPQVPVDPLGHPYVLNSYGKTDMHPESPLAKDQTKYQKPL